MKTEKIEKLPEVMNCGMHTEGSVASSLNGLANLVRYEFDQHLIVCFYVIFH